MKKIMIIMGCLWMSLGAFADEGAVVVVTHDAVFDSELLLDVIDDQLEAIKTEKIESAYRDFTSSKFQKSTSLEQFKKMVAETPSLSKNRSFQYQAFFFEDQIATFQGILVSRNGEATQVEYDLVLESGKWKVYGLQLFKSEMTYLPNSYSY